MKFIKSYALFEYGTSAAIFHGHGSSSDKEKASDKEDEFLILSKNVDLMLTSEDLLNATLTNVTIRVAKGQDKKGFFKRVFTDGSQILFTFDNGQEKMNPELLVESKGKEFKQIKSERHGENTFQAFFNEEQAKKFVEYLLKKSKWKDELKEKFPDIEKQLLPAKLGVADYKDEDSWAWLKHKL